MGKLDGRVVLISGGARGMGAAEAKLLAEEGAAVVIGDILVDDGKQVAHEIGERALFVELDVRVEQDWRRAVDAATAEFGKLDGLVNNAGVLTLGMTENTTRADFMRSVEVNQLGTLLGMQAVIPAMRAAGGGTIVNISSTAGVAGDRYVSAYCATKFAVVGLSRVAAMELGPEGIRVNTVCPGVIATDMTSEFNSDTMRRFAEQLPLRRFGTPAEVAAVVLFFTSADSSYVTGVEAIVDGGRLAGILPPA